MAYIVYVLRSAVNGSLYKGLTNDLDRRLKEHNAGKNKSTKPYRPWKIVYKEKFETKEEARERELYLKSGVGREYLIKKLDP